MNKREIMAAGELYMGHCFEKSVRLQNDDAKKKKIFPDILGYSDN